MLSFTRYTSWEHGIPALTESTPPDDAPEWDDLFDVIPELGLEDIFTVYALAEAYQGHPAGSICVSRYEPNRYIYWVEDRPKAVTPS